MKTPTTLYEIEVNRIDGSTTRMDAYQGKPLLIVNTASECGFTPQYEGLEELHKTYASKGLAVLGFPCNQFGGQEPGTSEEIVGFCQKNYGVTFDLFEKVDVNGDNAHPLFVWLKQQKGGLLGSSIKWNFTKFLVDKNGKVVGRYSSMTKPEALKKDIEKLL